MKQKSEEKNTPR